jgi:hypothetical protein
VPDTDKIAHSSVSIGTAKVEKVMVLFLLLTSDSAINTIQEP